MLPNEEIKYTAKLSNEGYKSRRTEHKIASYIPHDFGGGSATFFNDQLKADVYEKDNKIYVSFRGSDNVANWQQGNLALGLSKTIPAHYKNFADKVVDEIRRRHPDREITYTGHSSGAVMAVYAHTKDSKPSYAYAFDAPDCKYATGLTDKVTFVQANSIISGASYHLSGAKVYNINPGGNIITNHSMEKIYQCLLSDPALAQDQFDELCYAMGIDPSTITNLDPSTRRELNARFDEMSRYAEKAEVEKCVSKAKDFYRELGEIDRTFGISQLGKMSVVGSNLIAVHENVATLGFSNTMVGRVLGGFTELSSGMSAITTLINPYIGLYSAGMAVLQVFGVGRKKKKSANDPVNSAISSAMKNLHDYLNENFRELHRSNKEILTYCESITNLLQNGFDNVSNDINKAVITLMSALDVTMRAPFEEVLLYIKKLEAPVVRVSIDDDNSPPDLVHDVDLLKKFQTLAFWGVASDLHSILNGAVYANLAALDVTRCRELSLLSSQQSSELSKISGYVAHALTNALNSEGFRFPDDCGFSSHNLVCVPVWLKAITAYLSLIKLSARDSDHYAVDPGIFVRDLPGMIQAGKDTLNFLRFLRMNHAEEPAQLNSNNRLPAQEALLRGPVLELLHIFTLSLDNLEIAVFSVLQKHKDKHETYKTMVLPDFIKQFITSDYRDLHDKFEKCQKIRHLLLLCGLISGFSNEYIVSLERTTAFLLNVKLLAFIERIPKANRELHHAIAANHRRAIDYYLNSRVEINNIAVENRTPLVHAVNLFFAADKVRHKGQLFRSIRGLLQRCAQIDYSCQEYSCNQVAIYIKIAGRVVGSQNSPLLFLLAFYNAQSQNLETNLILSHPVGASVTLTSDSIVTRTSGYFTPYYAKGTGIYLNYFNALLRMNDVGYSNIQVLEWLAPMHYAIQRDHSKWKSAFDYYDSIQNPGRCSMPLVREELPYLLWVVALLGKWEIMQTALDDRAVGPAYTDFNANISGIENTSPLLIASEMGWGDVIEGLLSKQGVMVNMRDKAGNSPFFLACQSGSVDAARKFFNSNIYTRATLVPDAEMKKAFDYAVKVKNKALALMLRENSYAISDDLLNQINAFPNNNSTSYEFIVDSPFGNLEEIRHQLNDLILQESACSVSPIEMDLSNALHTAERALGELTQARTSTQQIAASSSSSSSARRAVDVNNLLQMQPRTSDNLSDLLYLAALDNYHRANAARVAKDGVTAFRLFSQAIDRLRLASTLLCNQSDDIESVNDINEQLNECKRMKKELKRQRASDTSSSSSSQSSSSRHIPQSAGHSPAEQFLAAEELRRNNIITENLPAGMNHYLNGRDAYHHAKEAKAYNDVASTLRLFATAKNALRLAFRRLGDTQETIDIKTKIVSTTNKIR